MTSKMRTRPNRKQYPNSVGGDFAFNQATILWQYDEIERLIQFRDWADPQIVQHGADTLTIAQLRAALATAVKHIDFPLLRISHPKDCELLTVYRYGFDPETIGDHRG